MESSDDQGALEIYQKSDRDGRSFDGGFEAFTSYIKWGKVNIPVPPDPLIKDTGEAFTPEELGAFRTSLNALSDADRVQHRNENATIIARHIAPRILIVSGPGTGKSTLFKQRINYWLEGSPGAKILTLSFVRKLVADLSSDIHGDTTLTDEQKEQVDTRTLHQYARSVVEQNHGSTAHRFRAHIRIIDEFWKPHVWQDALVLSDVPNPENYTHKDFEEQLHDANLKITEDWSIIQVAYFRLSRFYNASGFADLIVHAVNALQENPDLIRHVYFIVDEYQDFNTAEDKLINELTQRAGGILIAGDDDQVLYEKLKSGKADLIRNRYHHTDFVNAMLPFCGRSDFHITKSSEHFVRQNPEADCIEKVYLTITTDEATQKVQVIGCPTPSSAVDYVSKFIADNLVAIQQRQTDITAGTKKDPFLLILSPDKKVGFYHGAAATLLQVVEGFKISTASFPPDYYSLLNYYSLANHPEDNFTFRKVLMSEGLSSERVIELVRSCLDNSINLCNLEHETIRTILEKARRVRTVLDSTDNSTEKIRQLSALITITDALGLEPHLPQPRTEEENARLLEHNEEEEAEADELETGPLSAVELMSIVGSKGLSADHVIILGFDNVNMSYVTKNAFYVAMTRARKSLHLITTLKSRGALNPHQFLNDLPDMNIAFFSYKKTGHIKASIATRRDFVAQLGLWGYRQRR